MRQRKKSRDVEEHNAQRSEDLVHGQRAVEKIAPHNHVRGKQPGFDFVENRNIEGADDGKKQNDAHRNDDRCNGIFRHGRQQKREAHHH